MRKAITETVKSDARLMDILALTVESAHLKVGVVGDDLLSPLPARVRPSFLRPTILNGQRELKWRNGIRFGLAR